MASYEGNRLPAPGIYTGTFPDEPVEILYSEVGLFVKGGVLKPGQGVIKEGVGLKLNTSTNRYEIATAAADVEGFNRYAVDTGADASAPLFHTILVLGGKCVAANLSVGGTALTPTTAATAATALGGRYIAGRDVLEF